MGRRIARDPAFERWRRRFRSELAAEFGDLFADEAMEVLDGETTTHGENLERDRAYLEAVVPGTVLARRRVVSHG